MRKSEVKSQKSEVIPFAGDFLLRSLSYLLSKSTTELGGWNFGPFVQYFSVTSFR